MGIAWHQKYILDLKLSVLLAYSSGEPKCVCCGEIYFEFLTIDHMNGGGRQHRKTIRNNFYRWLKKNGYPPGFRILCMNCNLSHGLYGYCPHENKEE